ncbi:hypothetical protein AV521_00535 [Streptomyces sp. IMTB 2501]|nr:hypothetical protein AV521_00535 [Streptomyces sp. IMTB 2501]
MLPGLTSLTIRRSTSVGRPFFALCLAARTTTQSPSFKDFVKFLGMYAGSGAPSLGSARTAGLSNATSFASVCLPAQAVTMYVME